MNQIIISGRITNNPELKVTANGKYVISFSLAVTRDKENTDFINCVAFGKTAELINQYTEKGNRIMVNGSLRVDNYEVDGKKQYRTYVLVSNIDIIDFKGKKEDTKEKADKFFDNAQGITINEDDLPF